MTKRMKKAPDGNQLSHCTHLTKWQQKKFSKIIDEFKLDERDAGLPLEKKFTTAEIEAVVLKCNGLTHDILALLDTTQSQWAAYLKRRPDIAEIQKQARESVVDRAEAKMLQCVDSDNEAIAQKSAEFILKTLGRPRGWDSSSAQQITVSKDGAVDIKQIFGVP